MEPTHLPSDDGASIVQSLRASEQIHGYIDGSVADGLGAHAYTIRPHCETSDLAIVGTAMSPGDPDTISSLRPEHYGGLCIAVWLWIIEQKYGPIPSGAFTCHVDNDAVVKRINKGRPALDVPTNMLVTNYNLWIETADVLDNVECGHHFAHVKGHQDDFIVHKQQAGPLNKHAFWNVQMDHLAAKTHKQNNVPTVTPFFESSKIALMVNGSAVTTNVSRVIRDALVAEPMKNYMCEKGQWNKSTFALVDWKAMDRAMTSLSIHKSQCSKVYV